MTFSSPIFIFLFLPICWLICRGIPGTRGRNLFLSVAGVVFYAFGGLRYVPLFLGSVAVYYFAGRYLMRESAKKRKTVMVTAVVLSLAVLAVYKYADFTVANLNAAFSLALKPTGLLLPLAISFYTFQGISYVIDVYRNPSDGTDSFSELLLFMSFFPQLTQGPILRFRDFAPQLSGRENVPETTVAGVRRFIIGLAKKVILSGTAASVSDRIFALDAGNVLDYRLAWLAGICYALQIYYDFSGYSDMAVGLGQMFGFRIMENFRFPYGAGSVREFWRRWHISLSQWFRDYLYIPLGGNRKGKLRTRLNRMIVFLCTGIWHGANWTFVVWGVCHGILCDLEGDGIIPVERLSKTKVGRMVNRIYTFLAVMLLFVIFRADTLAQGWSLIRSIFLFQSSDSASLLLKQSLTAANCFLLLLGAVLAGNLTPRLREWASVWEERSSAAYICGCLLSIALFILCLLALARGGFESFIYAQF